MNSKSNPIYVVVEHGRVQEVKNIPLGCEVHVIDKDVEDDPPNLDLSPLDGDLCFITHFYSDESPAHSGNAQGT